MGVIAALSSGVGSALRSFDGKSFAHSAVHRSCLRSRATAARLLFDDACAIALVRVNMSKQPSCRTSRISAGRRATAPESRVDHLCGASSTRRQLLSPASGSRGRAQVRSGSRERPRRDLRSAIPSGTTATSAQLRAGRLLSCRNPREIERCERSRMGRGKTRPQPVQRAFARGASPA
jgi:hypothetical protein